MFLSNKTVNMIMFLLGMFYVGWIIFYYLIFYYWRMNCKEVVEVDDGCIKPMPVTPQFDSGLVYT